MITKKEFDLLMPHHLEHRACTKIVLVNSDGSKVFCTFPQRKLNDLKWIIHPPLNTLDLYDTHNHPLDSHVNFENYIGTICKLLSEISIEQLKVLACSY